MALPILTVGQMRDWEKATWASGQTEDAVIGRVGAGIAARLCELTRPGDGVLILAGKGNNGADARAAAGHLPDRRVEIMEVADPKSGLADFERRGASSFRWLVDGLFGIGLNRPLDGAWQELIGAVNASGVQVVAVDVPSGLDCETGRPQGAAVEAAITLTVGAPKAGLLAQAAWPFVGRLEVLDDVGLIPCPAESELKWVMPDDFAHFPPRRPVADHKGSFGHLAIVAGSFGFHGAAVLAARGALRAQPGLVTVYPQENVYPAVAAQLQSPMVAVWKADMKLFDNATAILIGPGLAAPDLPDEMRNMARRLWRYADVPVVVDASAMDWLPAAAPSGQAIRVITPHPGEAARLLNSTAAKVQSNRFQAMRDLSRRFGCRVVLKGHQTLTGAATGNVFVNSTGNPHLAQGGSGDVLSGFIAGFLAQPALQGDCDGAIRYAVWRHGCAGDKLQAGGGGWVIEDLIGAMA